MKTVNARNVNEAYVIGVNLLRAEGRYEDSRVGGVLVMDQPVTTTYRKPLERVLFNKARDANPFFHLMEGLWMLAGRNDVDWLSEYTGGIAKYSDDGVTFHGAYGHRWRNWFNKDQLIETVHLLRKDPGTRRAYIAMWDPITDMNADGLDFPCNVGIAFRLNDGKLDMTVFNRSNDIIWGAYGANVVHMSMLQEYMAGMINAAVGQYHQVSNNFHAYVDTLEKVGTIDPLPEDLYSEGQVEKYSMMDDARTWHADLLNFMAKPTEREFYSNSFFSEVAVSMAVVWDYHKSGEYLDALAACAEIGADDWRFVCIQWIKKRMENYAAKNDSERRSRQTVSHDTNEQ